MDKKQYVKPSMELVEIEGDCATLTATSSSTNTNVNLTQGEVWGASETGSNDNSNSFDGWGDNHH